MKLKKSIHINDVKEFLNDVKVNTKIELLEEANLEEVIRIAKEKGINLADNTDLAGFKTVYALTDVPNSNKCILPKEAVEASLDTLIGKPVDIDHERRYVVGHYIDKKLEGNQIVAYGIFYKSNFSEEWEEARELFAEGKLTTSFEIWCPPEHREQHEDGTYSLNSIEFAGGGLLFRTEPAFKDAKVLDLAKQRCNATDNLVFASEELITSDIELEEGGKQVEDETKKLEDLTSEEEQIENSSETPSKEEEQKVDESSSEEEEIQEEASQEKEESQEESEEAKEEQKEDEETADETKDEEKEDANDEEEAIETDKCICPNCSHEIEHERGKPCTTEVCPKCGTKMTKKINEAEQIKTYSQEEVDALKAKIEELEKEMASIKEDYENRLTAKDEKVNFYKENAKVVFERRNELGEFASDLSDEELLNDDKYEIAKLKKENTLLKANKDENQDQETGHEENIEQDKTKATEIIDKFAFEK